ncbi:hypothetical protein SSS_01473, partial [Sarcoptes scabiei]
TSPYVRIEMTTRFNETILLVRSICHSIRTQVKVCVLVLFVRSLQKSLSLQADVTKTSLFNIMKRIIRQNEITDLKLCRAPDELKFIGECYGTYLESGSKHHHLITKHYLKPEFNVKRTADFLGFKLP